MKKRGRDRGRLNRKMFSLNYIIMHIYDLIEKYLMDVFIQKTNLMEFFYKWENNKNNKS